MSEVYKHKEQNIPALICELCQMFYQKGWATGTGGGVSIKQDAFIYIAPSGVQKERIKPEHIFTLDEQGNEVSRPSDVKLKLSQCTPLFMLAYNMRNAGTVIH